MDAAFNVIAVDQDRDRLTDEDGGLMSYWNSPIIPE